jgi:small subunit ribosomal protein S8
MSQDIVADGLNMIKNAKQAGKERIQIKRISNLLIEVLKIMKSEGAIQRYKINKEEKSLDITLGELMECKAVKPRFTVDKKQIEKYKRRYLPARNIGILVVSTNQGLMTHLEAQEKEIGGCLIAYFY